MKKLSLKFFKEVSYWNPKEGAGVRFNGTTDVERWCSDISSINTLLDIEDGVDVQETLLHYLNNNLGTSGIKATDLGIADDGRLWLCVIEDGEGDYVDDESKFVESNPNKQLYICDYDIFIDLYEVTTLNTNDLGNMFPNIRRGD